MNKEEMLHRFRDHRSSISDQRAVIEQKDSIRCEITSQVEEFLRLGGQIKDLGQHRAHTVPDPTIGAHFRHGVDYAAKRLGVSIALLRRACREKWGPDHSFENVRTTKELRFTTAAIDAWKPKIKELVKEFS